MIDSLNINFKILGQESEILKRTHRIYKPKNKIFSLKVTVQEISVHPATKITCTQKCTVYSVHP